MKTRIVEEVKMEKITVNYKLIPHIRNILPFRFLSEIELNELISLCDVYGYGEGETIIKQGECTQSLLAVVKGNVKVTVTKEDGEAYISTLGSSEVFGEAGMFMKVERTANVSCLEDSIIFSIERKKFLTFIKNHPTAGNKIFMIMIYGLLRKLKEANRELAYERKTDISQIDIDNLVMDLIG